MEENGNTRSIAHPLSVVSFLGPTGDGLHDAREQVSGGTFARHHCGHSQVETACRIPLSVKFRPACQRNKQSSRACFPPAALMRTSWATYFLRSSLHVEGNVSPGGRPTVGVFVRPPCLLQSFPLSYPNALKSPLQAYAPRVVEKMGCSAK